MNSERLERLLAMQDEARAEKEEFKKQREEIMRKADEAGRPDLSSAEDAQFRALTENIRDIDVRLALNDEKIRTLADLQALDVMDTPSEDDVARGFAAAAEIYTSWRSATLKTSKDAEPQSRRNLTVAEARAVLKLDQT